MIIINGKETSQKIRAELKIKAENLKARFGVQAGLAVVLAGNDPASKIYVTNKVKACAESGVKSFLYELPDTVTESEILELVEHLNNDKSVHGILVQLPLPNGISSQSVISAICPSKDVDGFSPYQAGRLATGNPLLVACTPKAVMELLSRYNICVSGKNAVIIGRSNIVGKPLIHLLLDKNATVTVCHSKTRNLKEITKNADILISAIGRAKFVTADMVKDGAVVIDVGINRTESGGIAGDIDYENVKDKCSFITPVPGGVGPMTITMLIENTIKAYELSNA